jgi:hypothetical protein
LQFIISGSVVVAATAIGERVGQKWSGLLVAFPIWTILTYIFLSLNNKNVSHHEYLLASLVFMIPAAVFIVMLMMLHNQICGLACLADCYSTQLPHSS